MHIEAHRGTLRGKSHATETRGLSVPWQCGRVTGKRICHVRVREDQRSEKQIPTMSGQLLMYTDPQALHYGGCLPNGNRSFAAGSVVGREVDIRCRLGDYCAVDPRQSVAHAVRCHLIMRTHGGTFASHIPRVLLLPERPIIGLASHANCHEAVPHLSYRMVSARAPVT